jgi:O-antigen ligase
VYGDDGIPRLHTHNGYLEWLLSFGALGAALGLVLLFMLAREVWRLDRAEGGRLRTGLLVFGLVFSMSGVLFIHKWWIIYGSLFLASVDREAEEAEPALEGAEDASW